jgi:hypothetical protein
MLDNLLPEFGFHRNGIPKKTFLELGEKLVSLTNQVGNDEEVLNALYDALLNSQASTDRLYFQALLQLAEGQSSILGTYHWARGGYPQVELGEKYCAALLATVATKEVLADVESPFRSFLIEVPGKLLQLWDEKQEQTVPVRRILVVRNVFPDGSRPWSFIAYSESPLILWRSGIAISDLQSENFTEIKTLPFFDSQQTTLDKRCAALIGRLIINVCLAFSSPENVQKIGKSHVGWKKYEKGPRRQNPEPVVRVFRLGQPTRHDLRPAVSDYLYGRANKLQVQLQVAGHWKMQACGKGLKERKLMWIEPYWRGAEDAPILVRSHKLGK